MQSSPMNGQGFDGRENTPRCYDTGALLAPKRAAGWGIYQLRHGSDARSNITIKRALSKYATSQRKALALTLSFVVLTDASDGVGHGSYNWRQGSGGVCDGYLPNKAFTCEGRRSRLC